MIAVNDGRWHPGIGDPSVFGRLEEELEALASAGLQAEVVQAPDAAQGMSASLRRGAAGWAGALMILPADMPEIDADMIAHLIDIHHENRNQILRGAAMGRPGHPVIRPADMRPAVQYVGGDEGARRLLARHPDRVQLVDLPGRAALTDLDTPEDWQAWRSAQDR